MEQNKLLSFLRSNNFAMYLAIASVIALAPNTYFVFSKFSILPKGYKEAQSLFVCLILSGAILFYTIRNNIKVAQNFAWFEFGISCCYYIISIGWSWYLIPAFAFAAILPVSVYNYSSEIGRDINKAEPLAKRGAPVKYKK